MALQITRSKPPPGAVVLSRDEALEYQWKQIMAQPKIEMWPFSWGIVGLGTIAATTSMKINQRFRTFLKLGRLGHFSTGFPLVIVPALFTSIIHVQTVTQAMLLEPTKCPLCFQTRAIAIQLTFGIAWPAILSPLANFMYALNYGTHMIPHYKDFKGTFNLWSSIMGRMGKSVILFTFIQILAASCMTYAEAQYLYKLQCKLATRPEENEAVELNKLNKH